MRTYINILTFCTLFCQCEQKPFTIEENNKSVIENDTASNKKNQIDTIYFGDFYNDEIKNNTIPFLQIIDKNGKELVYNIDEPILDKNKEYQCNINILNFEDSKIYKISSTGCKIIWDKGNDFKFYTPDKMTKVTIEISFTLPKRFVMKHVNWKNKDKGILEEEIDYVDLFMIEQEFIIQ